MKRVAEVRKQLGVPTIFNLLGPLSNPAGAPFQVVGVGRTELRPLLAEALHLLGTRRALVVQGEDGLDEVTLFGPTRVTEVTADGLRNFTWTPSDFGLSPASLESLQVDGPEESARDDPRGAGGQTRPGPRYRRDQRGGGTLAKWPGRVTRRMRRVGRWRNRERQRRWPWSNAWRP